MAEQQNKSKITLTNQYLFSPLFPYSLTLLPPSFDIPPKKSNFSEAYSNKTRTKPHKNG